MMEKLRIRCPCCDSIFEEYPERKIILDKTKNKKECICKHKERYHSWDMHNQKYVCRVAYCDCYEFKEV